MHHKNQLVDQNIRVDRQWGHLLPSPFGDGSLLHFGGAYNGSTSSSHNTGGGNFLTLGSGSGSATQSARGQTHVSGMKEGPQANIQQYDAQLANFGSIGLTSSSGGPVSFPVGCAALSLQDGSIIVWGGSGSTAGHNALLVKKGTTNVSVKRIQNQMDSFFQNHAAVGVAGQGNGMTLFALGGYLQPEDPNRAYTRSLSPWDSLRVKQKNGVFTVRIDLDNFINLP